MYITDLSTIKVRVFHTFKVYNVFALILNKFILQYSSHAKSEFNCIYFFKIYIRKDKIGRKKEIKINT